MEDDIDLCRRGGLCLTGIDDRHDPAVWQDVVIPWRRIRLGDREAPGDRLRRTNVKPGSVVTRVIMNSPLVSRRNSNVLPSRDQTGWMPLATKNFDPVGGNGSTTTPEALPTLDRWASQRPFGERAASSDNGP